MAHVPCVRIGLPVRLTASINFSQLIDIKCLFVLVVNRYLAIRKHHTINIIDIMPPKTASHRAGLNGLRKTSQFIGGDGRYRRLLDLLDIYGKKATT